MTQPMASIEQVVRQAERDIPGALPFFEKEALRGRWPAAFERYDTSLLRSWLQLALARLQTPAETSGPTRVYAGEITFVKDAKLRQILEADLKELQRAYDAQCLKSVVILCGAAIEAILIDALMQDAMVSATTRPEKLLEWGLADLIAKATQRGLIEAAAGKFSHAIRDFRNLVHPGRVVREQLSIDAEEARIAIEVLNIVCRDLARERASRP